MTTTSPPPAHRTGAASTSRAAGSPSKAGLRIGERFASPGRIGALVALVVLAVLWLLPFLWAVVTSFKTETDAAATPVSSWLRPSGFTTDAYASVLREGNIPLWTWNSLVTAAAITVITLVVTRRSRPTRSRGSTSPAGAGCSG